MKNYLVLDIETTGLNPHTDKLHGIGVVWPNGVADYHTKVPSPELRMWLRNPDAHIVGHNIRFDIKFLITHGVEVRCKVWDTKLLAQLIDENQQLGLKPLSEKYFGTASLESKRELDRAVSSINGRSVADLCQADIDSNYTRFCDLIAQYCIEDCQNTKNLWEKLITDIKTLDAKAREIGLNKTPLNYYIEETMPLEYVLRDMELAGIRIDTDALVRYRGQLLSENDSIMHKIKELTEVYTNEIEEELYQEVVETKKSAQGKANVQRRSEKYGTLFNWQSADHLSVLIFKKFMAPTEGVERTATGKLSTSESTLEFICKNSPEGSPLHVVLSLFAKWKKNLKLLNTYTGEEKGLLSQVVNGRVYADYLQAGHGKESSQGGTVTGRLSSRNPNMQNLPRGSEVKRFFVPDPGHVFIYFDYSQLELRLAAHLSQDPLLIKAYNEGIDLHQITANSIGEDRQVGKTINFAMIYDASPWRLSEILGKSVEECKEIIKNFYNIYYGYSDYLVKEKKRMLERGWVISQEGRVRRLTDLRTQPVYSKESRHAVKQGYNFPIQSLGASITKRAMIELHRQGYKLVTQVHDSVVIQVPTDKAKELLPKIVHIAETIYPCSVPIKVDAKILTSLHESDKLEEPNEQTNSNNRKNQTSSASLEERTGS